MPSILHKRPPFDPRFEFVVVPPGGRPSISVSGKVFSAGQILDKSLVTPRCLRQMYEASRVIAVAPGSVLPQKQGVVSRPSVIGPVDFGLPNVAEVLSESTSVMEKEVPVAGTPKVKRSRIERVARAVVHAE